LALRTLTIGHGTRSADEFVATVAEADARTLVDVRRYPGSRRNPQFNQRALAAALAAAGIRYVHAVDLGGRRSGELGEERFACIRTAAFRSYAARMGQQEWQEALAAALAEQSPCFMCAEIDWRRCHRRLIADLLAARGHAVLHLLAPSESEAHTLSREAEAREGKLYLCGELVA
jgi:uncharacterized protein (DUF488 family)